MSRGDTTYFQCCLQRHVEGGVQVQTTYLPERFADTGHKVKLKNHATGEMEDGWVVTAGKQPGEQGRSGEELIQAHRQIKGTRRASDLMRGEREGTRN